MRCPPFFRIPMLFQRDFFKRRDAEFLFLNTESTEETEGKQIYLMIITND